MADMKHIMQDSMVEKEQDGNTSIMEVFMRYIRYWKWFLASISVLFVLSFLYIRYTTPIYKVTSSIILKDAKSKKLESGLGTLDGLGLGLMGAVSNVENEMYIMESRSLVRSVINRLNLHTSYIVEGRIKETDLYTKSPVIVDMDQDTLDSLKESIAFTLHIKNNQIEVYGRIKDLSGNVNTNIDTIFSYLPALLRTPIGNISFTQRHGSPLVSEKPINVIIQHPDAVIKEYRENLTIQPASKIASVLDLSIKTAYPDKGKDFLNTLVDVYNNETIEDNKMEVLNTQKFINERILIINSELSEAEKDVEEYKRSQGLTDIQTDLQRNVQMGSQYEKQLVQVETQLSIVRSLNDYVNDPQNKNKTIPTNVGVEDPTLAATTSEYNRLLLERERLSQSMTADNPAMKKLEEQIAGLRQNINSSVSSVQKGLAIQRRDARNQAGLYDGKIGVLPRQEREFMELSREQQIKAGLFLMLLQKREENALALAATANSAKVLDEATLEDKVFPRTAIILLAALLLGLLIPAGLVYLLDILQYKIRTRADVDRVSKVPVLGEIPKYGEDGNVAVKEGETREIDEAFRMARTNLMLTLGSDNKVVIFTSTVSGEGKSFVALNTAISTALLDKKVLLIGMDLRIPRLKEYLNLKTHNGLTNYLSGFEKDIDSLIVPSGIHPSLDVLPSGPVPPNPAELLSRSTLDKAIAKLREEYDYIFIDSAPSSQVTDTLIINRVSDTTVYVCRADYSSKGNLRFANELMAKGKLNNMLLVINDVTDFHRGYGYGYGSGYGYGYGNDKKKKSKLRRKSRDNKHGGMSENG